MASQPPKTADQPALRRGDVAVMAIDQLERQLVTLTKRLATGTYELLVLVGELDARGAWSDAGSLSCSAWLADLCGIELSTARTHVRVARAMRAHPTLDEAMRTGLVSYAKARTLAPYLTDENAEDLVEIACRTPAGRLGAAIAAWSQRHEDPDTIAERQHQQRSVTWRTEPDGMVTLTARLAPTVAAEVCAVIDRFVISGRDAPAGACDEHRSDASAGASLRQQRADAMARAMTSGGDVTTEVVIHVRPDGNTFADGTPLADNAVAALLPDAFISLLVHDSRNHPIDASPRRRTPTRRQQRVVDARYATCQHPGCTATVFLQYDHIEPYHEGGPTTLDNLQRLCGPHNRAKNAA